jgi:hypothetical protein
MKLFEKEATMNCQTPRYGADSVKHISKNIHSTEDMEKAKGVYPASERTVFGQ